MRKRFLVIPWCLFLAQTMLGATLRSLILKGYKSESTVGKIKFFFNRMSIPLDGPVMETMSLTQRSLVVIPLHLLQLAPDVYSIVTYLKIKKFASEQETTGVHIERSIPNDIVNGFLSVFHFWALIRAAKTPLWGTSLNFAAFFRQRKIMP